MKHVNEVVKEFEKQNKWAILDACINASVNTQITL